MTTHTTMKQFTMQFECNDVFADDLPDTIADALLAVSKQVRRGGLYPNASQWVRDNYGNRVGTYKFEER